MGQTTMSGAVMRQDLGGYERRLAVQARRAWHHLPAADVAAAVDAGMLTHAVHTTHLRRQPEETPLESGERVAAAVGHSAAQVQRQGLPPDSTSPVAWHDDFGSLIPVVAASSGAGASVVAAVVADAVAQAGWRTMLADTADPVRSGLAMATSTEGPVTAGPDPAVRLRFSWRGPVVVARVETSLPVLAPGMVPPPPCWQSPFGPSQVTVIDLAHDSWRLAAHPLTGAGQWLRHGTPSPRPLLVCRATRPSVTAAEQVLARLEHWVAAGVAVAPAQLVVTGDRRWPAGVAGVAGRRLAALVEDAVFLPWDRDLARSGITDTPTPAGLRAAVTPLLRRWGVLNTATRSPRRADAPRPTSAGGTA
ncbi:hypothetical protein MOQ72_26915 [Saccharopolyspora sp. K220]|uniref:hypothetical protein n=1 Tax=Saccharopolyspora soli TaxID=2926618 RepID=UPI001F593496|nr:hypothetical protein [Saccharopolyspora soli]MCI2421080.1 hypothetical protein [Saccharopolyspora soli]